MQTADTNQARGAGNAPASKRASNKQVVLDFYELAPNQQKSESASRLLGPGYVQHSPLVADHVEGVKAFIDYQRDTFPEQRAEVKQIFAEDDFVIAHVHAVRIPGQRGYAIVDIFRLEDGKIVEHWDVTQPIPADAENPNGMF
jgi:predicted SnoaL-like aldol condensation-catalyzing enzyme